MPVSGCRILVLPLAAVMTSRPFSRRRDFGRKPRVVELQDDEGLGQVEIDQAGNRRGRRSAGGKRLGQQHEGLEVVGARRRHDAEVDDVEGCGGLGEVAEARAYCEKLIKLMRLPSDVEIHICTGDFREILPRTPPADINIFGMPEVPDMELIRTAFEAVQTSVLFLRDSEHESAVA